MLKSALLRIGRATGVVSAAGAQPYYPHHYPGYGYHPYPGYTYPAPSYSCGYSCGWPYLYPAPTYRPAPAYSDPYVAARPFQTALGVGEVKRLRNGLAVALSPVGYAPAVAVGNEAAGIDDGGATLAISPRSRRGEAVRAYPHPSLS
jgi:hypothetical protein